MSEIWSSTVDLCLRFWPQLLGTSLVGLAAWVFLRRAYQRGANSPEVDEAALKRPASHSLKRLAAGQFSVLDEIYLPRHGGAGLTRIDHVVLSAQGIFIIQLQQEMGVIIGSSTERHWCAGKGPGKKIFTNPIIRNSYHVKAMAEFLELPKTLFFSVIFFEKSVTFSSDLPKYVLAQGLGRHIISHKTKLISPEALAAATARIKELQEKQSTDSSREEYKAESLRRRHEVQAALIA